MKKNAPLISVVMPSYNGGKYIKDAIDSILNQTISDFEFIIIDGYSDDETDNILATYTDKRIQFIKRDKNGIGDALKYGCSIAKGKYIARMDTDDISFPNRFEKELKKFKQHKNAVLVSSTCWFIDHNSNIIRPSLFPTSFIKYEIESICHPCVMMLKSAYEAAGGYAELIRCEDIFMWKNLSSFGSFYIITEPLIQYRLLSDSLNKTLDNTFIISTLIPRLKELSKKGSFSNAEINEINIEIKKNIIEKEAEGEIMFSTLGNILLKLFNFTTKITGNYKIALYAITFLRNSMTFFKIITGQLKKH